MSKIKIIMSVVLFSLCFVGVVFGQYSGADKGLGVFGGLGLPQSSADFKDLYDNGFGFGLEYKKHLMNKTNLVFSFAHTMYAEKKDVMTDYYVDMMMDNAVWRFPSTTLISYDSANLTGGGLTLQQFSLGLQRYILDSNIGIYVVAAPGLYLYRYEEVEVTAKRYQNDTTTGEVTTLDASLKKLEYTKYCFALNLGAGVELNLATKFAVFIQGSYNYVRNHEGAGGSYRNFISGVFGMRYALPF